MDTSLVTNAFLRHPTKRLGKKSLIHDSLVCEIMTRHIQTFRHPKHRRADIVDVRRLRRGAALLFALFVMTVASALAISMADSQSLRYASTRNTRQWDQARYLAEAGLNDALAQLEHDFDWRDGIGATEFPAGSRNNYQVSVRDGTGGEVLVESIGRSGGFTRTLVARLKQGG
jgi:hypothetical protein